MERDESPRTDLSGNDDERAALDWSAALDAMGGDQDLLRSIGELLIADAPRQVDAIHAAILQGNAKDLRRAAHTLKGSLRYFGSTAAGDVAARLEQIGHAGQVAGAADLTDKLDAEVARVLQALLDYVRQKPAQSD